MNVKQITLSLTAKIPMQDYGSVDATATFQAEINENEGDSASESARLLGEMVREELMQSVMPLIQNRLDFTAYLRRHWPSSETNDQWDKDMESDQMKTLMRSGIVPVSVMLEAIEAMKEQKDAD